MVSKSYILQDEKKIYRLDIAIARLEDTEAVSSTHGPDRVIRMPRLTDHRFDHEVGVTYRSGSSTLVVKQNNSDPKMALVVISDKDPKRVDSLRTGLEVDLGIEFQEASD